MARGCISLPSNHPARESPALQSHKQFPGESRFQIEKGSSLNEREREREAGIWVGVGFGLDGAVEERGRGIRLVLPDRSGDRLCGTGL